MMMKVAVFLAVVGLACGAAVVNDVTCSWEECDNTCDGGNRVCHRSDGKTWNIDCHVQDCTPVVGCGNADVVYVIDASASIGEKNWWKTKQFVIDVSKGLTIGPNNTRVSVVIYSNDATVVFTLDEFNTIDLLENIIWDVPYIAGNTNTYMGLFKAEEVIDTTGRQDFKQIVIVITDGKANNQASKTIPQAEAMHAKGIEIFCVGISGDVDADEIDGMASLPKDVHSHYITDYDALVTITNVIINDTCEAANLVECDAWNDWTDCLVIDQMKDCGPGLSSRWRLCRFYLYEGADVEIRIHTEHRLCEDSCAACARCEYDVHGVGYFPHDNCHQFIQCEYVDGGYIEHEKNCGALFWRQSILGCDREHDVSGTCTDGPIIDEQEVTTPAFVCDKDAHATDAGKYVWHLLTHDVVMPCAYGTVFNAAFCQCVHGGGNDNTACNSEAMLEFPFNSHTNDICNRAAGTALGNVTLHDGAAYFDGSSRVEVGYLKNWFAQNPTTAMTVSMWFRYTGSDDDFRGIFSNGDCVDASSLLVAIGDDQAQATVIADQTADFDGSATNRAVAHDSWMLATLVYSGWDAKYYINGVQQASISISGAIQNSQSAANIGFSCQGDQQHYFEGFIDDVRVYTKTLWDFDITQLYNNGRQ